MGINHIIMIIALIVLVLFGIKTYIDETGKNEEQAYGKIVTIENGKLRITRSLNPESLLIIITEDETFSSHIMGEIYDMRILDRALSVDEIRVLQR